MALPGSKTKTERFTVEQVAAALIKSGGIFMSAAKQLGCAPNTVAGYVERHPELQRVCDEAVERTLDLAETKLLSAIKKGQMQAVLFVLRTKGKHRGYSERHEVTGAGGVALLPVADLNGLTDEQVARLARGEPAGAAAGPVVAATTVAGDTAASGSGAGEAEATPKE